MRLTKCPELHFAQYKKTGYQPVFCLRIRPFTGPPVFNYFTKLQERENAPD